MHFNPVTHTSFKSSGRTDFFLVDALLHYAPDFVVNSTGFSSGLFGGHKSITNSAQN